MNRTFMRITKFDNLKNPARITDTNGVDRITNGALINRLANSVTDNCQLGIFGLLQYVDKGHLGNLKL